MLSTVIKAFIAFISTDIDDIFVLMVFFTQVNQSMKKWHIVAGQYLGIGALTAVSIIGALGISIISREYVGFLGLVPIYFGVKAYIDHKKESTEGELHEQQETTNIKENQMIAIFKRFIQPSIVTVAAVTFANGGDNIGIYIPLFASMSLLDIGITVIIFALMVAVWCFLSQKLAELHYIKSMIEKFEHILVPVVFIGLGIFIFMESGTINLLL